jgi:RNA polymerase sigma-70 factor (family 1)
MHLDKALISGFNKDSPDTFAFLFKQYYSSLCSFAERFVHGDDAKDVVSDVFSHLWHKQTDLKPDGNIQSFLYTSVRNACVNLLVKQKRQSVKNKEVTYYLQNEDSFETEVFKNEVLDEIFVEIETLPDQCRNIFKMLYIEGLSYKEVSQQLGLAEQTIRNQKGRAVLLLRKRLFPDSLFTTAVVLAGAAMLVGVIIFFIFYHNL